MPLNTQIVRKGRARKDIRWGGFHVAAMVCAAAWDSGKGPFRVNRPPEGIDYPNEPFPITRADVWDLMSYPVIATTPLNAADYTVTGTHRFVDTADGEVFEILPGDVLRAWRD